MLYTACLLLALGHLYAVSACPGQCTGDAEADLNRIEYQIPMDASSLRGDTEGALDTFMEYLDEILEDQLFYGFFDMKKDNRKRWLRSDRSKACEDSARKGCAPKASDIKYRQSIDIGYSEQYQNDFTLSMGYGRNCDGITCAAKYDAVCKCKQESNMFPDSCLMSGEMESSDYTTDGGNGFAAKIEFDDDDAYGTGDADAVTMVDEDCFAKWPYDCASSCLPEYFVGDGGDPICDLFRCVEGDLDCSDKDVFNFVLQVPFEVNYIDEADVKTEVSEGRLVFQVRFDTMEDWNKRAPTGRETELSVKAYQSKTSELDECGAQSCWDYTVDLLNRVTDAITKCGSPWVRYDGCTGDRPEDCPTTRPTMSPTHSPGYVPQCCQGQETATRRQKKSCARSTVEGCLLRKKKRFCELVDC